MAAVAQPVLANCFQAGTSGTAITAGTGCNASLGTADGAQFDTVSLSGASTLDYSSAFAHSGTLSCQVSTPSTGACYLMWNSAGLLITTAAQTWFRLYLYQAANPASVHQCQPLRLRHPQRRPGHQRQRHPVHAGLRRHRPHHHREHSPA